MTSRLADQLHSRRGISVLAVILLIAVIVMSVLVIIPWVRSYRHQADDIGCDTAMESARRQIIVDYLLEDKNMSEQRLRQVVERALRDVDDMCPVGGEVYVVTKKGEDPPFALVCGLHGSDAKQNTRLNAQRVLDRLNEALQKSRLDGKPLPETLTITLHGKPFTARLTAEPIPIKRGTGTTSGYEGTVAFYGIAGNGELGQDTKAKDGEICYLCFADEQHCAIFGTDGRWSGDSYR